MIIKTLQHIICLEKTTQMNEIQKKKERLLLEYLVRIKEIARDYDKSLTRNKEKIKNDDILNSTIVDIFKNSSL